MYIGTLHEVVFNESNAHGHVDKVFSMADRAVDAVRNNNDDDQIEYQKWKKYHNRRNKGLDGTLKNFGYKKGLKTQDEDKTIGYRLIKGGYKLIRPIGHVADHISKGIDYIGDKIKSTSIGKKLNDTIDDYYYDDHGKHGLIHGIGSGLTSYAAGRANAKYNNVKDNKYYKAADAGIGAVSGINAYQLAQQRAKRTPAQIEKIRWMRDQTEKMKRKERDERMDNFWKEMKA